jgi:mono/diheme cytochrome c family protein
MKSSRGSTGSVSAALSVGLLLAAGALVASGTVWAHGQGHNPHRASYVEDNGIPEQYRDLTNPRAGDAQAVERGRELYAQVCAVCHGAGGSGNGPAASGLDPAPVSLDGGMMNMPAVTDGYLFWTISEGGAPTGSAMPPFEGSLSVDDRWALVSFLRRGFDGEGREGREDRGHMDDEHMDGDGQHGGEHHD